MRREKLIIVLVVLAVLALVSVLPSLFKSEGAITGAVVACEEPYTVIEGLCCLDENKNNVCDDRETVSGVGTAERVSEVVEEGEEESTENTAFYWREYPEIEKMFGETGSTLKNALEQEGYDVTHVERNEGVKEIKRGNSTDRYDPLTENYAFVAIDKKGLTKENVFGHGYQISEDVIPYMKSYYRDSDVWMVWVHDSCGKSVEMGGSAILCIFSIPELTLGGCGLREAAGEECYGIVTGT